MPLLVEPARLCGVVVAGHHEVAPGEGRLGASTPPLTASRAPGASRASCERLARTEQRLGGDARPVVALAAHQLALDDRHAQAAVGQQPGAVLPARARAHDHDVVAHAGSLPVTHLRACRAALATLSGDDLALARSRGAGGAHGRVVAGCGGSDAPDHPAPVPERSADERLVRAWSAALGRDDFRAAAALFAGGRSSTEPDLPPAHPPCGAGVQHLAPLSRKGDPRRGRGEHVGGRVLAEPAPGSPPAACDGVVPACASAQATGSSWSGGSCRSPRSRLVGRPEK